MSENEEASKKPSLETDQSERPPKRIRLSSAEFKDAEKEQLFDRWKDQEQYVNFLESRVGNGKSSNSELAGLRESEEKLKQQQQESTRRENVLVMRLATKEQEMQDLLTQIHDLKQAQNPSSVQLRSTLLDPAVNLLFQRMKTELDDSKEKLEQAQNDLSAWKFTPDSVTGKKLMAKCRNLIQENQELGKQLSQGRVAQLEAELALQKKYSDELKSSQDELNDFVIQLDEEVEGMQSTILTLQQQLKDVKHKVTQTQEESSRLKAQLEETESEFAAVKAQTLDSPVSSHTDRDQDIQGDTSVSSRLPEVKAESRTSDGESASESEQDSASEIVLTSQNEDNCTSMQKPISTPSSFSISKLLAPDTNKTRESVGTQEYVTRECVTEECATVTKGRLENGQGQERDVFGSDLHHPATPQLTSKGVTERVGAVGEIAAYNGEMVN